MPVDTVLSIGSKETLGELLPEMFDHISDPVVVTDSGSSIVYVNSAFSRLVSQNSEDLKVTPSHELLTALLACSDFKIQHSFLVDADNNKRYQVHICAVVDEKPTTEKTLKALQQITSDRALTFDQRVQRILKLGCDHFRLTIGCVSSVEGDRYTITHIVDPDGDVKPGMTFDLADTYCKYIMETDRPVGFHQFSKTHSKLHSCFVHFGLEDFIGAPIYVDGVRTGTITFSSPLSIKPIGAQDLEIIDLFAGWLGHELARQQDLESLEAARNELERLASEDPLTGLMNRRRIERWATTEYSRALRHDFSISVGLVDVDNFKALNDRFGHETGDWVLQALAAICQQEIRSEDAVARWGGEEFLFLFTHSSVEEAETVIKRIADRFRNLTLDTPAPAPSLTLSAGVLQVDLEKPFTKAISSADVGLYQAKNAGKDRIVRCFAGSGEPAPTNRAN